MKSSRLVVVALILLAVAGLVTWWGGAPDPDPGTLPGRVVPVASTEDALSVTWFCSGGTAATVDPVAHSVIITNPDDDAVVVRMFGYGPDSRVGPVDVEVPAGGPLSVDVGTTLGDASFSVMVESPDASLVVAHSLTAGQDADEDVCSTFSSGTWFFPSLSTTRDAGARLTLFNPFPGDAGVDVEVVLDTGVRVPTALTGIVVPAGTARVIDLGETVQRRDQFSIAVRLRSGRLVAEATQTFDGSAGPRGLWMAAGVPRPAARWVLAGGFTGTGVSERLVVQNPLEDRARVVIQVTPYGASTAPPEPLEVDVPGRRYAVVDLSAEGRIPPDGYHSITVESRDGPVVVARTTAITAGPTAPADPNTPSRPSLTGGVAVGTGSPVSALQWIVPSVDSGADPGPVVFVHNPGPGISVVSAVAVSGGAEYPADGVTEVEIPPGDSRSVPVPPPTDGARAVSVRVTGSSPIVVEALITYPDRGDLAMVRAVPLLTSRSGLHALRGE